MNLRLNKISKIQIIYTVLCIVLYFIFAYHLTRTDYVELIILYSSLFFLFYKLIQTFKNDTQFLIGIAILFRLVFLFAIPNLSQDFYRFIWDGRMLLENYNPYLFTPHSFISNGQFPVAQAQELYNGMGELNASHFTNYPPINQLCFVIANIVSGKHILGAVMVMRILIILADIGIFYFGKKLLKKLNIPIHHIFIYILNPFIIIELTGNLHFEAVMLFFLVWSFYLLYQNKWIGAAIVFSLSVSVKLIPLLFLPLFFQYFISKDSKWDILFGHKIRKLIIFYLIILGATVILFTPFYSSEFITNYTETVGLWFQNFEFNASLYYIARAIGYQFRGWNEIALIGKYIPVIVLTFILILTFFRKNKTFIELITAILFALSFYYFTATTVHPWYIATLLLLSVFTTYKFPLVWSFIIIISYLAYANTSNTENLWIIGFEYLIVFGVLIWEIFNKKTFIINNKLPKPKNLKY